MATRVSSPSVGAWARLRRLGGRVVFGGNRYDRAEVAGAFGDLGTFIPFVVAYITIARLDPAGILLAFGLSKLAVGLYCKTPVPVQPMKAVGAAVVANPGAYGPGAIWGAGVFTSLFWFAMAATGAVDWVRRITAQPVVRGIMLGLGFSFVMEAARLAQPQPLLAGGAAVLTLFLLSNRKVPAMAVLLAIGMAYSLVAAPELAGQLATLSPQFRLPGLTWGEITWQDLAVGSLALALPQAPLTLGNAVLGTEAENNRLFPDRPVTVRQLALGHGLMNALSAAVGGIPLCHGAGGLAGHVRFGARTGGALVMLGLLVTALALFFADSVMVLLALVPPGILGVILFFTGLELASSAANGGGGSKKEHTYVMLVTAGLAMVNMGVAFLAGLMLHYALEKGLVTM